MLGHVALLVVAIRAIRRVRVRTKERAGSVRRCRRAMPQSRFLDLPEIVKSAAEKTWCESADILLVARNLRARAEEALVLAEIFDSPHTRQMMGGIAATYEKMAERLEQHAGDADKV
jgi:hypothetical protein